MNVLPTERILGGLTEAAVNEWNLRSVQITLDHLPLVRRIADEFPMHPFIYAYTAPGYGPGKEYPLSLTQEVFRLNLILKESGMAYKSGRVLPAGIHMGYGACNPHSCTVDPEGRLNGGYRDEKNWNEKVSDGAGCRCPGGNPDRVFGRRQTGSD